MGTEEDIVRDLIAALDKLGFGNEKERDLLCRRAEMVVRRLLGDKSRHLQELAKVSFWPSLAPVGEEFERQRWSEGVVRVQNILTVALEEFRLFGGSSE